MKTQTVRKARIGRKRLQPGAHDIADLIGSVDGLPADLSARTKHYVRASLSRKRCRKRT